MSVSYARRRGPDPLREAKARFGEDWPGLAHSQFIETADTLWHGQIVGESGPWIVLLHGTGASTHSWRDVTPLLAQRARVLAVDLPGHGLTAPLRPGPPTLPRVAEALGGLLRALDIEPAVLVGHSAGAAIAIRMVLDGAAEPGRTLSLNGALAPFAGVAGQFFPAIAKTLFLNPFAPRFFAWRAADAGAVAQLLNSTGSQLTPEGRSYYARLFQDARHVDGVLSMMAHWELTPILRALPSFPGLLTLIVSDNDRTVPPADSERAHRLAPQSTLIRWPSLGHLAHEEDPARAAQAILEAVAD